MAEEKTPLRELLKDRELFMVKMNEILQSPLILEFIEGIKYPNFEPIKMRQMLRTKVGVEDIIFLCIIAIGVGDNTTRIISIMKSGAVPARLASLKNRLGIKDSAMKDPKAVTLPRVLACFPELAIEILQQENPEMMMMMMMNPLKKVLHEELKLIHAEYPVAARTSVAASVLPYGLTKREAQNALALLAVPSLKWSEVIKANSFKWVRMSRKERAKSTVEYVRRFFNAEVLSKEQRASRAVEFGMVERADDELVLTGAWRAAGAAAAAWLQSEYDFNITYTLDCEMMYNKVRPDPNTSE